MFNRVLRQKGIFFTWSYLHSHNSQEFLFRAFVYQAKGILHIGAYDGQSFAKLYSDFQKPVIHIEANPQIYQELLRNISKYHNQVALNLLLGDRSENVNFYISSNLGSSSIFQIKQANNFGIQNVSAMVLAMDTLSNVFREKELQEYDFWVLDVQGAELSVLQGAADYLVDYCKYLWVECSINSEYIGGAEYSDLLSFLCEKHFIPLWENNSFHSDVMFVNISKLSKRILGN